MQNVASEDTNCKHKLIDQELNWENVNDYSIGSCGLDLVFKTKTYQFPIQFSLSFSESGSVHFGCTHEFDLYAEGDIFCEECDKIYLTINQWKDLKFISGLRSYSATLEYLFAIGFKMDTLSIGNDIHWKFYETDDFDSNPYIEYQLELDEEYQDLYEPKINKL